MTADELARKMEVGCDYCGATSDLEQYIPRRLTDWGFRCRDAVACHAREVTKLPADDEEEED